MVYHPLILRDKRGKGGRHQASNRNGGFIETSLQTAADCGTQWATTKESSMFRGQPVGLPYVYLSIGEIDGNEQLDARDARVPTSF
jgi:hypothetical protein